ncbi:mitochondrial biogenesis AIM24-domain-containing protein [Blastocladiella britannica]|nr:mitochondrial biogenesis AIM24-domain-containing protein [Blastocladiella britannica]
MLGTYARTLVRIAPSSGRQLLSSTIVVGRHVRPFSASPPPSNDTPSQRVVPVASADSSPSGGGGSLLSSSSVRTAAAAAQAIRAGFVDAIRRSAPLASAAAAAATEKLSLASSTTDPAVPTAPASFRVIDAGLGSMVVAALPPGAKIYAVPGSSVGHSINVSSAVAATGGPVRAVLRKVQGGPVFFQVYSVPWKGAQKQSAQGPGEVLIAPKNVGDVAVLELDGGIEYFVRRHAYLASTAGVSLAMRLGTLSLKSDTGLVHYRAMGLGQLAITTYGGLYRIHLGPGEKYCVAPKHLIAWTTGMTPEKPSSSSSSSSSFGIDLTPTPAPVLVADPAIVGSAAAAAAPVPALDAAALATITAKPAASDAPLTGNSVQKTVKVLAEMARDAWTEMRVFATTARSRVRAWALGGAFDEVVELTGPGDFYVASRVLPRFDLLRNISAVNAEEKKQQSAAVPGTTTPDPNATTASSFAASMGKLAGSLSAVSLGIRQPVSFPQFKKLGLKYPGAAESDSK